MNLDVKVEMDEMSMFSGSLKRNREGEAKLYQLRTAFHKSDYVLRPPFPRLLFPKGARGE
jgi:hypothetical protein